MSLAPGLTAQSFHDGQGMTAPSGATLRTSAPLARDGPLQGARRALEDTGADIRYALRTWLRQPGFVLVAVLSLACGIGLNTAVFSIINAIFLQGIRGVPAADRVVELRRAACRSRPSGSCATRPRRWTAVAAWQPIGVDLRVPRHCDARRRAGGVGQLLRDARRAAAARALLRAGGRPGAGADERSRARLRVLDEDASAAIRRRWRGRSSSIACPRRSWVSRRASFHGFGPERPPLWMPMGMLPAVRGSAARWDDPAESGWRIFGRLTPGGSVGQVNAELRTLAARSPGRLSERRTGRVDRAPSAGAVRSRPRSGSSSCSSSSCRW